jgi:hypothetical protein
VQYCSYGMSMRLVIRSTVVVLQLRSSEYLMIYQLVYGLMSFVGCVSVGAMRNRLSFVRYHTCIAFSFTSFLQAGRRRLRLLMTLLLIFPWGN